MTFVGALHHINRNRHGCTESSLPMCHPSAKEVSVENGEFVLDSFRVCLHKVTLMAYRHRNKRCVSDSIGQLEQQTHRRSVCIPLLQKSFISFAIQYC